MANLTYESSVDHMEIDTRIRTVFYNEQINTVLDIYKKGTRELLRTPNFGHKSLIQLQNILFENGLKNIPTNGYIENQDMQSRVQFLLDRIGALSERDQYGALANAIIALQNKMELLENELIKIKHQYLPYAPTNY